MSKKQVSIGLLVASLVVFALAFSGLVAARAEQDVAEVLRARAIELVDARGQARAQIQIEDSGEVVFRLRDSHGTIRVKIGAAEDGSGLLLLDEKTEPGVQLLAKDAGTSLALSDGAARKVLTP